MRVRRGGGASGIGLLGEVAPAPRCKVRACGFEYLGKNEVGKSARRFRLSCV